MKLAKIRLPDGESRIAAVAEDNRSLRLLDLSQVEKLQTLADMLHAPDPLGTGPLSHRSQGRAGRDQQGDPAGTDRPAGSLGGRRDL